MQWIAQTGAVDALLKDYSILMEAMDKANRTTREEYGLKAGSVLSSQEKFDTRFGLKLSHLLFSAVEEMSKVLKAKDTSLQDALKVSVL